jgi:hypothetical protein
MTPHTSNISVDILWQLCTSCFAMILHLGCYSIVEFIFNANFFRCSRASPSLGYFDCAIVLLCKSVFSSSWSGLLSSHSLVLIPSRLLIPARLLVIYTWAAFGFPLQGFVDPLVRIVNHCNGVCNAAMGTWISSPNWCMALAGTLTH